jgi:hypothetical protein
MRVRGNWMLDAGVGIQHPESSNQHPVLAFSI